MHDTDHAEFQDLLPDFESGALADVDWLMMRTHLAECAQCRAELRRPELHNRAAPRLISPGQRSHLPRETAPAWLIALSTTLVAGLVAFAIAYALTP